MKERVFILNSKLTIFCPSFYLFFIFLLTFLNSGVAEWVRASALSHTEWMIQSPNPSKSRNYFYSQVGDGGLNVAHFDGYIVEISTYVLERVAPFIEPGHRTINDD